MLTLKVLKVYDFATAASTYINFAGTNLNISDEGFVKLTTPFPIRFGGQFFTDLYVSDDGYLSFDAKASVGLGFPIPAQNFGTIVAPLWSDLNPVYPGTNNVYWGVIGNTPNRQLVIEWRDVPPYPFVPTDETAKFQVVLNESSDEIDFNYADVFFGGYYSMFYDAGARASVGLQSTSDWGNAVQFVSTVTERRNVAGVEYERS